MSYFATAIVTDPIRAEASRPVRADNDQTAIAQVEAWVKLTSAVNTKLYQGRRLVWRQPEPKKI